MPTLEGIHHLGFSVTDRDRSTAWYRDVLGFEVIRTLDGETMRRVLMRHPGGGIVLGLAEHAANPGNPFNELTSGLDHLAFQVPDRAELEGWLQRFEELGVDHSPIKEGVTGWLITFRDPDNIQLEVYTGSK